MNGGGEHGLWAPERRLLTIGLVLSVGLTAIEALAVITVLPLVKDDLHGLQYYGWATSAFFLGTVMGVVLAGREADRHGLVTPFMAGSALFAAGLVVCGTATSMAAFIAGRAVQGLGAGAIFAISYVAIARAYTEAARPRVFAVLSSAWALPAVFGPGAAALVAAHFGWRWVFLGLVPLVVGAGLATLPPLRSVPNASNGNRTPTTSTLDAARITVGVGLVLWGVSARSLVSLPLLAVGAVLAGPPIRDLVPSGARGLSTAIACSGLIMFAFFGTDTFVPLTITSARHRSTGVASIAVTSATLAWTTGAWVQAHQRAAWPRRRLIALGFLLVALGTGGVAAGLAESVPVFVVIVSWAVGGLGMGLGYTSLAVVVLDEALPGREGAASAAVQLLQNVGVALGTGVAGGAVAAGAAAGWRPAGGLALAFAITAVAALLGIPLTRGLPRVDAGTDAPADSLAVHDGP